MLDFAREIAMLHGGARLTGGMTAPARQERAAALGCAPIIRFVRIAARTTAQHQFGERPV